MHSLAGSQVRRYVEAYGNLGPKQHLLASICTQRASLKVGSHLPQSKQPFTPLQCSVPDVTNF